MQSGEQKRRSKKTTRSQKIIGRGSNNEIDLESEGELINSRSNKPNPKSEEVEENSTVE